MKIQKIVVQDPECEWSILFDNGGVLTMEWHGISECMISMDTEVDHLDPDFLRKLAQRLEAIAFMAAEHVEALQDDPGDGYTTIFIEINDMGLCT